MSALGPFRNVVSHEFQRNPRSQNPAHGSRWLLLECGHKARQNSSETIPKRVHCYKCAYDYPKDVT